MIPRTLGATLTFALAAHGAAAAQDFVRDRATFGIDTLFGPGIVEVSASGSSVRFELARDAHVLALVIRPTEVARVVEPRRNESRETRAGRFWLDLLPLSSGAADTGTSPSSFPAPSTTGRASSGGRTARRRANRRPRRPTAGWGTRSRWSWWPVSRG